MLNPEDIINKSEDVMELKRSLAVNMSQDVMEASAICRILKVSVSYVSKWKIMFFDFLSRQFFNFDKLNWYLP